MNLRQACRCQIFVSDIDTRMTLYPCPSSNQTHLVRKLISDSSLISESFTMKNHSFLLFADRARASLLVANHTVLSFSISFSPPFLTHLTLLLIVNSFMLSSVT
ncbi:hypothetical protein PHAVU_006G200200 [Phaseolus vulgaris]|uniref:Uncharacterized protein n=1 Tax=Phaseolus vulgaris TaxID=3885 RepID=V7BQU0_PHAVU|nr:hypothetical protein PHAVU_006G200200g [Phaseolus vulgaris]ESW20329.1 hypothetical protein PHAVU_006G200200g [Phaseolus vulgaris]